MHIKSIVLVTTQAITTGIDSYPMQNAVLGSLIDQVWRWSRNNAKITIRASHDYKFVTDGNGYILEASYVGPSWISKAWMEMSESYKMKYNISYQKEVINAAGECQGKVNQNIVDILTIQPPSRSLIKYRLSNFDHKPNN